MKIVRKVLRESFINIRVKVIKVWGEIETA